VLYSSATAFPSYWAAAPVIGTALVILAGPYDGLVAGLLQNPVALFVGAISYSVYLVHWPLLVIPEAASSWMQPLELWQSLTLGALAIPLGWLSYRFVETPFRNGKATNTFRSTVLPLVAAVMCAVILAGLSMIGIRHLRTQSID